MMKASEKTVVIPDWALRQQADARVPDWAMHTEPVAVPLGDVLLDLRHPERLSPAAQRAEQEKRESAQTPPPAPMLAETEVKAREQAAYARGLAAGRDEIAAAQERYEAAVEALANTQIDLIAELQRDAARVVMKALRQILQTETTLTHAYVQNVVVDVLRETDVRSDVTLRVNAQDKALLEQEHPEYFEAGSRLHVVEDPSLVLGGVVAECELGLLDAGLGNRMAMVETQLLPEQTEPATASSQKSVED